MLQVQNLDLTSQNTRQSIVMMRKEVQIKLDVKQAFIRALKQNRLPHVIRIFKDQIKQLDNEINQLRHNIRIQKKRIGLCK